MTQSITLKNSKEDNILMLEKTEDPNIVRISVYDGEKYIDEGKIVFDYHVRISIRELIISLEMMQE